jgi:hypothetical protein
MAVLHCKQEQPWLAGAEIGIASDYAENIVFGTCFF